MGFPSYQVDGYRVINRFSMGQDVFESVGASATPGMFGSKPSLSVASTFGVVGARGANKRMLEVAEHALLAGKDADEVRRVTGWFKGMEGKPRFEISDKDMVLKKPFSNISETYKLSEVIDHPALFENYPELKDVVVNAKSGTGGSFTDSIMGPYLNFGVDSSDKAGTIAHEIQHWIQQKEGFARGGRPSGTTWASKTQRPELLKTAQQIFDEWKPASYEEFWGKELTTEGKQAYQRASTSQLHR